MGIFLKNVHNILFGIWRWAVLCKKQDGGWIKICETISGNSLKEDLSIDTTFDPCYFSWDSPFNDPSLRIYMYIKLSDFFLKLSRHFICVL